MYYIYILYSNQADKFYLGQTSDPNKRVVQHLENEGKTFTGKYPDWEIRAVFEAGEKRSEAMKLERFLKRQKSRSLIEKLVDPEFSPTAELAQLVRVPHVRD